MPESTLIGPLGDTAASPETWRGTASSASSGRSRSDRRPPGPPPTAAPTPTRYLPYGPGWLSIEPGQPARRRLLIPGSVRGAGLLRRRARHGNSAAEDLHDRCRAGLPE